MFDVVQILSNSTYTIKYGVQTGKSLVTIQCLIAQHFPFGRGFRAVYLSSLATISCRYPIGEFHIKFTAKHTWCWKLFIFSWSNSLLLGERWFSWATLGHEMSQPQAIKRKNSSGHTNIEFPLYF